MDQSLVRFGDQQTQKTKTANFKISLHFFGSTIFELHI